MGFTAVAAEVTRRDRLLTSAATTVMVAVSGLILCFCPAEASSNSVAPCS